MPSSFLHSILLVSTLCFSGALAGAESDFDWRKLNASKTLNWTPCYSAPLECALLQVPMDYSAPQNEVTASIAIVRYPSTSPKSQYRGPLLFNPGGPGGSGVDAIVGAGAQFAMVFGEQFDIVGVSYSTPTISFFKTEAERRFLIPSPTTVFFPSLNASSSSLADTYANMQLLGQLAIANDANGYLQHMSTDNIARDMLSITEAFGFEKLQYWGVSYGSVLGATFATLFPLFPLGTLVPPGLTLVFLPYLANFTSHMLDTDKSMDTFYSGCAQAGPQACAFHAPTASQVAANLAALTASITAQPIAVLTPQSHGILNYVFLRNAVLNALYDPYNLFAALAEGLAALASGNATLLYAQNEVPTFECDCTVPAPAFHENSFEAYMAIACGDALPVNDTLAQLQQFYEDGLKVSAFADVLSSTRVVSAGYKIHREGRFTGPVGAKNTSFPLLLVGNTFDPVTPHADAVKTSLLFPGSAVLTQDSVGHTTLVATSDCTFSYYRAYFVNGTLPAPGTVCSVNAELFPSSDSNAANGTAKRTTENLDEIRIREATSRIGSVVRKILRRAL
ncbi:TAP-like protein-domain-containing protein [Mycena metata]|uniref:TAP-like protein-domain-containing protein n=1 Tax=Mycena metata TaxID=1033252 RepID=A0AAD7N3H9_9AGAR|nr:TAP-like protein-domain-containing protein [Mycena metata]